MKKKLFSLPFNSALTKEDIKDIYLPFLDKYREYIHDIYFSVTMPPFSNDAMGQGKINKTKNSDIIKFMLFVQKEFDIEVSATFNNILVAPDYNNQQIFIKNFKTLYDVGIRSVTIPHMHWMLNGEIKNHFPKLKIKNTVLRKVNTPQQYASSCEAGFDIVNIDRMNIRDLDNLKKLKKAYDKYKKPMAILVNEGCKGQCPVMDEHYTLNCSLTDDAPYFSHTVSQFTCPMWSKMDPAYHLRVCNMPAWREDFEKILEYVQILKLHGRSEKKLLFESLQIVRDYAGGGDYVVDIEWLLKHQYDAKKLQHWREFTKNCKFECWNCKVCDDLASSSTELTF
jgi:hypothetical protein